MGTLFRVSLWGSFYLALPCGFVLMVLLGGFIELDMVWIIADIVNALMALPNLIALLVLSPVVIAETKKYFDQIMKSHSSCDFLPS